MHFLSNKLKPLFHFKSLYKVTLFIVLTLTLFTPIITVTTTIFPFIFSKAVIFYFLVEISFILWLIAWHRWPLEYAPQKSWLLWLILGFLAVNFLAMFAGVNIGRSFWSTYERMDGVFNLLHLIILFIILQGVLRTKKDWQIFLSLALLASVVVAGYAIKQYNINHEFYTSATLGNPIFLGAYGLIYIFLGLILALTAKECRFFKLLKSPLLWLSLIGTGFNVFSLIVSGRRGPLFGFVAGLGLCIFLFIIVNMRSWLKERRKFIYILGILTLIIASVYVSWNIWNNLFFQPLKSIIYGDQSRFLTWQSAWESILQRPFLGWGPENFYIAENYHYKPERILVARGELFDKVHSKILETGVNVGFLGLISYLAIFIGAGYLLLRRGMRRGQGEQIVTFLLIGLLAGYFIQNLTAFDTPAVYLSFFLSLTFANWFIDNKKLRYRDIKILENSEIRSGGVKDIKKQKRERERLMVKDLQSAREAGFIILPDGGSGKVIVIVSIILISLSFWFGVYKPWKASHAFAAAIGLSGQSEPQLDVVLGTYQKTLDYNAMNNYEPKLYLAKFAIDNYSKFGYEKLSDFINLAQMELEKEVLKHPRDVLSRRFLAQIYNLQEEKDSKFLKLAVQQLEEARAIAPRNPIIYLPLGMNYYNQDRYKDSIDALKTYLKLHPNPSPNQASVAYLYIGASFAGLNNKKEAITAFKKSVELDPSSQKAAELIKELESR